VDNLTNSFGIPTKPFVGPRPTPSNLSQFFPFSRNRNRNNFIFEKAQSLQLLKVLPKELIGMRPVRLLLDKLPALLESDIPRLSGILSWNKKLFKSPTVFSKGFHNFPISDGIHFQPFISNFNLHLTGVSAITFWNSLAKVVIERKV